MLNYYYFYEAHVSEEEKEEEERVFRLKFYALLSTMANGRD